MESQSSELPDAKVDEFQSSPPVILPDCKSGHRTRLLDRFVNSGVSALHPHEILELLLTYVIPRRDTKPLAHQLIVKFKTVGAVINAPIEELMSIKGIGYRSASLFPLIRDLIGFCLKERYDKQDIMTHRQDVEEYLRFYFGQRRDEYVAALYLDSSNHILQTTIIAEGTVNQCAIYPRNIIAQALRCGAASIILTHNHPSGGLTPSEADWLITERMFTIGKMLEIPLLDHIIISHCRVSSLRDLPRWPK